MSQCSKFPIPQMEHSYLRYAMWGLPLAFFTYQFILRLWPSLMMQQIMEQFTIDATGFGFLVSAYYYGYAGMQLPVAILLDRYGPRYVLFGCAVTCGLATFLFSWTTQWEVALISRFLIGVGSAAGFLATSKVISQWFSKDHYGLMIGLSFSVGLMGAIYGGKPVGLLVTQWGERKVAAFLALVSILIGVGAYVFLRAPRDHGKEKGAEAKEPSFELQGLGKLITSPSLVLLALANLLMVGALDGFADVWGVNYLMASYNIPKLNAAELNSFIYVGMLFGGPLLNKLSQRLGNYTVLSLSGMGIGGLFLYLIFLDTVFNFYRLSTLFFGVGILCCYQVLVFSTVSQLVASRYLGIAVAFLNCVNMLGGSFFHTIMGYVMDFCWTGHMVEGIRHYNLESYTGALMVIPLAAFVGSFIMIGLGWCFSKKMPFKRKRGGFI